MPTSTLLPDRRPARIAIRRSVGMQESRVGASPGDASPMALRSPCVPAPEEKLLAACGLLELTSIVGEMLTERFSSQVPGPVLPRH